MSMLNRIRNIEADRMDLDEFVELLMFGKLALQTYSDNILEPPQWLVEGVGTLEKTVKERRRDNLEKAMKEKKARLETLKSAEEKRADLLAEIAKLQAALG